MAEPNEASEQGTKTVRIAGESAKKLQTISALKDQMNQRFKAVEFLNGLVEGPINELYNETVAAFNEFQAKSSKPKDAKKKTDDSK